jgi:hypothetical protein
MKTWIKKILGVEKLEQELAETRNKLKVINEEKSEKIAALQEELEQKETSDKDTATQAGEPYISIVSVELDKENPSYGSFELDWNEQFVKKLRSMGYPGETDEIVVDLWFQSVCRNILMETWEQEAANRDNIRYISRRDIGGGKTEVS